MSYIINFSEIIEANGKTIRENNMELQHKIPVGTLVDLEYTEYYGYGAGVRAKARMYVVGHCRDCDGTPLYSVAGLPLSKWGRMGAFSYEKGGSPDLGPIALYHIRSGYSEEKLTPVEITPAVLRGEGCPGQ